VVAISTPVFDADGRTCLGVVAMTVEVGRLLELRRGAQQFAVLVDRREGANQGVILQHPLYDKLLAAGDRLPDRFKERRLAADALPSDDHPRQQRDYQDPLAADEAGGDFDRHWLARMEPVAVRDEDTGWVVIIQESYDAVIGATLDELSAGLLYQGLRGLAMVALLLVGIWLLAARLGGKPARL
jgi:hypothetical protein